jgi:hypothetical protein
VSHRVSRNPAPEHQPCQSPSGHQPAYATNLSVARRPAPRRRRSTQLGHAVVSQFLRRSVATYRTPGRPCRRQRFSRPAHV